MITNLALVIALLPYATACGDISRTHRSGPVSLKDLLQLLAHVSDCSKPSRSVALTEQKQCSCKKLHCSYEEVVHRYSRESDFVSRLVWRMLHPKLEEPATITEVLAAHVLIYCTSDTVRASRDGRKLPWLTWGVSL